MKAVKHEIFINGYIGEMFDFFGDGNSFSLKNLNESLASMPADVTEINVHINSGGGLVSEGFAIYDKLITLGLPVNTIVEGMCGSIATVIAQAGKTGSRKMFQNSEYFIHNPLWIPNGPDAHTADDLEKLSEDLRKNEEKLVDFYVKTTGADKTVLAEKMKVETTLTAAEAKSLGFIDEVISTDVVAMVKYRIAAAVQPIKKQNNDTMATLKTEITAGFSKLENLFKAMKGKVVNMAQDLADGTQVFTDTDNVVVGTKVFSDEAMTTPVKDGDYILADGTTITVATGVVTVVTPAVVAKTELELANEKIAILEAQLAAKNTEVVNAKAEVATVLETATKLETEFVNFKNQIIAGGKEIFEAADIHRDEKGKFAKNPMQLLAEKRAEQDKNKK